MKLKLDIQLDLNAIYDPDTNEIEIINSSSKIIKKEQYIYNEWMEHKLTDTQINYGILTLGSRSKVGSLIKKGQQIKFNFIINNNVVFEKEINSHSTAGGRLDKLKEWYNNYQQINNNTILLVRYDIGKNILEVKIK